MSGASDRIESRWTHEDLARRRKLESYKGGQDLCLESHSISSLLMPSRIIRGILRFSGLYERGHRNLLKVAVRTDEIVLPTLPPAFDGLRILHVSDAHFDLEPRLAKIAAELAEPLEYDICVFTGDFRDHLSPSGEAGVRLAIEFLCGLGKPVYACLGNHDLSSDLCAIEDSGIRVLMNANTSIERGGQRIVFCGVDDPGYFKTDDFAAAFCGVGADDFAILLSHDPCAYKKALKAGASLILCGHTHGGQICLPGEIALLSHTICPRRMIAGAWKYKGMSGYTSSGIGGSRVAARFFSKGEMTIHILRRPTK